MCKRGKLYGKLFDSMYDGTLAGHWQAIVTLQQLIILANADGVVDMTVEAIARRTTIPERIISAGITFLLLPDQYSRTPGEDGKRIVPIDEHRPWGWRIVNHGKYKRLRDMEQKREADRERQSEKRRNINDVAIESQKSPRVANVAHADAYADAEKRAQSRGSRLTTEWFPSDALTAWACKARPDLDLPAVVEKFKDYWLGVPAGRGVKLDWEATFRNWVREEKPGRPSITSTTVKYDA